MASKKRHVGTDALPWMSLSHTSERSGLQAPGGIPNNDARFVEMDAHVAREHDVSR